MLMDWIEKCVVDYYKTVESNYKLQAPSLVLLFSILNELSFPWIHVVYFTNELLAKSWLISN